MENKKKKSSSDYYITRKDITPVKDNPWARELVHTMKRGTKITGFAKANHQLVNTDTGEITGDAGAVIGTRKITDRETFVKFFGAGLIEAFELSKPAKDVFKVILHGYLESNTLVGKPDQVYIKHDVAVEELGYTKSKTTFNNGMNELCIKQFMAPVAAREGFYWLNPNLFFKGDRMRIVREYVVEGTEAEQQVLKEEQAAKQMDLLDNQEQKNDG